MSKSSNDESNSDLTDGNATKDPDMKKKNLKGKQKDTKQKMKEALNKKQKEQSKSVTKQDPTVVLDMSDEDPNDGSQR